MATKTNNLIDNEELIDKANDNESNWHCERSEKCREQLN